MISNAWRKCAKRGFVEYGKHLGLSGQVFRELRPDEVHDLGQFAILQQIRLGRQ
jgi:hypothetical protein